MARTLLNRALCLFGLSVLLFSSVASAADYKMCFLMFANVDDLGWSFSVNVGRLNAKTTLQSLHPSKTFDSMAVPNCQFNYPTQEDKDKLWQSLLDAKCNIIVSIGCNYLDQMTSFCPVLPQIAAWQKRADAYPNIHFLVMWDAPEAINEHSRPNLHFFIMDQTPAYFLAGVAAATQATKCVGMMFPYDWNRNSHDSASGFALGVQYVKPTMPVHMINMQSFYAPGNEILVTGMFQDDYGCDVTARYSDPRDADVFVLGRSATNGGKMSIGSHADLQRYVGDTILISTYGEWDKVVVPLVSDIVNFGKVQTTRFPLVYGTASGAMQVSVVSPKAKPAVQPAVDAARLVIAVNDTVICGTQETVWGATISNDASTGCRNRTQTLPGPVKTKATVYHGDFQDAKNCANGSYASYNTASLIKLVCTVCPENTYAISGAMKCTPCPQGLLAPANASGCYAPAAPENNATPIIASVVTVGGVSILVVAAVIGKQRYAGWKKNQKAPRQPPLCLLFTDVEGSTDLWNQNPEAMAVAMNTHHATIRRVIEENGAYEIKTIGDAFMIACERAIDGVSLAVDIQRALQAAEWPDAFQTKGPWNGLKVRIGVHHCTEVEVKFETLHNYYDYYGNDVNITARVEAFAQGGQICLTQSTWREVVDHPDFDTAIADDVEASPWAKDVQLKGVDGGFTMYSIVPRELAHRDFQPPAGHENDFGGGDGKEGSNRNTSESHSTGSSTFALDEINSRIFTAVILTAFMNVSPPVRRQVVSALSRDLSLQVITNQRRALSAIAVELGRRSGVNPLTKEDKAKKHTQSPRVVPEPVTELPGSTVENPATQS